MNKKQIVKKRLKRGIICASAVSAASLAAAMELGRRYEWGPFFFLNFLGREREIVKKYSARKRRGEIIFYGASNFRRWEEMDQDMLPYTVQNHGFGGSTDAELMRSAGRLLYRYKPAVVVLQTGSNDCARLVGPKRMLYERVLNRKMRMLETFHRKLPDTIFIVISGILMPGRRQYDNVIKRINRSVQGIASQTDYIYYVDAEDMTVDENGKHRNDLFIEDGVHLTHEARILWAEEYIKPALGKVISDHPELAYLKRK